MTTPRDETERRFVTLGVDARTVPLYSSLTLICRPPLGGFTRRGSDDRKSRLRSHSPLNLAARTDHTLSYARGSTYFCIGSGLLLVSFVITIGVPRLPAHFANDSLWLPILLVDLVLAAGSLTFYIRGATSFRATTRRRREWLTAQADAVAI